MSLNKPDINKPIFKMFPELADDVSNKRCPICKEEIDINAFKDELSRREFGISGLCQACQDEVFK